MMRARCALLLAASGGAACAVEFDPAEVLGRVSQTVEANFARTPRYTCVETVVRDYYRPIGGTAAGNSCSFQIRRPESDRRLMATDRLRLEVTMANNGEIYSWLGASRFHEGSISDLITHGPIATGAFAAALAMVFREKGKHLRFERAVETGGRMLVEYSYAVAREDSKYKVRTLMKDWYITGYYGTVLADPASGDVVQLMLATTELPPVTASCQTLTRMEFTRQQIGGEVLMLPHTAQQTFIGSIGNEVRNSMSFSGCREYAAESTVSFFQEPGEEGRPHKPGASVKPAGLPAGLRFTVELLTPISSETAAAGDLFQGRLAAPLLDANQNIVAPKGAPIEGRLLQVQVMHDSSPVTVIVMRPRTIQIRGAKVPLAAYRDWAAGRQRRQMALPEFWEPDSGIFQFPGEHVELGAGFRSDWRTR